MNIIKSGKCNNSPKNAFVEDFTIRILTSCGQGSEAISIHWYGESFQRQPDTIQVIDAISHGKIGAANGMVSVGDTEYGFAAFVEFKTTKATEVSDIKLYIVEV
ncbi:hypothetical protein [Paenibacillus hunanensis]|uniref:Uncharacterized protein n=1 Tax=Paenibacillus hunanensis TaxID=539262 RepID=A0ABU1J6F4_9BACL|nr:hypothetical protein [Paenibacillus hunanensis]MDR6246815.1 hypothetical protein [Paenibacillus hunanensis]GGJ32500.1 hypothetical protein GCM10008022_46530 [Paenibacillus hunanensis]